MLFHQPFEQRARVARVVDRERLREAELLGLAAQDAHARRVERRDPHALRAVADQLTDALAHLARGLVRERDREDLARPRLFRAQQRGDAAGQHARLARSGTGDDQQRGSAVGDRFALRRVEAREQVFVGAHRTGRSGGGTAVAADDDDGGGCRALRGRGGVGHVPPSLGAHPDTITKCAGRRTEAPHPGSHATPVTSVTAGPTTGAMARNQT